jgi:hypothetical protein
MQVPIPTFIWKKQVAKHPVVQADPSQVGGGGTTEQLPPTQVEPLPPQSESEQQDEAQAQVLPCLT